MKQFVISSEVSSKNFSNNISLEKNCVQGKNSDKSFADFVSYIQDDLNDYVFPIVNINTNSLVQIKPIDWVESEEYINHVFSRVRTEYVGYLIHYDNCSVAWYKEHGEIYRLCVKIVELKNDECVLVSQLNTNDVHMLNKEVSMKFLDNLWLVTQLYEKEIIDKYYYNNEKEKEFHYTNLWRNLYERECEHVDNYYVYNQTTRGDIKALQNATRINRTKYTRLAKKLHSFNEKQCPVNYFFSQEKLDYNDYDMNTGEVIEYTNKDYAEGKHKEDALLVTILRSEDDLFPLFEII